MQGAAGDKKTLAGGQQIGSAVEGNGKFSGDHTDQFGFFMPVKNHNIVCGRRRSMTKSKRKRKEIIIKSKETGKRNMAKSRLIGSYPAFGIYSHDVCEADDPFYILKTA